jgi:hypothetical protein
VAERWADVAGLELGWKGTTVGMGMKALGCCCGTGASWNKKAALLVLLCVFGAWKW